MDQLGRNIEIGADDRWQPGRLLPLRDGAEEVAVRSVESNVDLKVRRDEQARLQPARAKAHSDEPMTVLSCSEPWIREPNRGGLSDQQCDAR